VIVDLLVLPLLYQVKLFLEMYKFKIHRDRMPMGIEFERYHCSYNSFQNSEIACQSLDLVGQLAL